MLLLVESQEEKAIAQLRLEENVRNALADQGKRNIGFPSGNRDEIIYSNGEGALWAAFGLVDDAAIARRWNVFGTFEPKRQAQFITVEINIATKSNTAGVAGFFAKDPAKNLTYLMHNGRVGGGKPGVGRNTFLAWSKAELHEAVASDGSLRTGIIVGVVESDDLASRLWKFVQLVRGFKLAAASGELESPEFRRSFSEWEGYKSESSGRRQGRRRSRIDFVSYHGDVVQALHDELIEKMKKGTKVSNSPLIDLYVRQRGKISKIFEVKTSLDRQSLYTAIGQLICHSTGAAAEAERVLVVPEGPMPHDLNVCLLEQGISVRRFTITSGKAPRIVLL